MKFPQKSKLTSRRSVCMGKGGTACEPMTALCVPLGGPTPTPKCTHVHLYTDAEEQVGFSMWEWAAPWSQCQERCYHMK